MGKFSDLLFGGKKGRGSGADGAAGSATPMVVDIVVPGRPGGAKDTTGGFGAHEAEGGLEASASLGSLHELTLSDSATTVASGAAAAGSPAKPAPRPSAWQRMRHNNALGGLNPLGLMRGKSKTATLSKVAATNAAAVAAASGAQASSEGSSSATASPAPTSRTSAAAVTATPPPAASAGIVVSITSPSNESLASGAERGGASKSAAATPIGGKPKTSKTNVTPLQLPGDRPVGSASTGRVEISTGGAGTSPKSPNSGSTAAATDTDSQHADILRRRRVELFSVLMGSHDLLPEFRAKYELISDLGVGAFGFVISARDRAGGKEVAVKFISKESVPRTSLLYDDRLGMIPSEIFVLRRLKHPHILGYIESFGDAKYYYMVTELHGDIWGPKGIEKDPVYTYRPLNASGLNSAGSPGSSLTNSSREGMSVHSGTSGDRIPPGSPASEGINTGKRKGSKGERGDSPRDSVGTTSSSGASSTATAGSTLSPPPSTRGKKAGKSNKRSTGSASSTLNHVMQLLKTKVENMDGRRHSVSLPPRGTIDPPPRRIRKLSDPLWGRFLPSTTRRAYSRDLFDCIDLHRRLSEPTARKIFSQVLSAVAYLQSQNLAHGDIKDENILVDRNFDVRLIDFGATSFLHQRGTQESFIGTMHYASPEILLGGEFDHAAAEVWTLGILLYTMMVGTSPFNSATDAVNGRFRIPRHLSTEAASIIRTCLQPNPLDRASVSSLLKHPWLRQQ